MINCIKENPEYLTRYLQSSQIINFDNSEVSEKAQVLARDCKSDLEIAESCFLFVRDEIFHSWDHKMNPVTLSASDVLEYKTGHCYAKSHLLAALLRANEIPAGLCYQRLICNEYGQPFFLHGLNAIWLKEFGWYRADARGLKPGCEAAFSPPVETLPYRARSPGEADLPEIWEDPVPKVIEVLSKYSDFQSVRMNLPDIEIIKHL